MDKTFIVWVFGLNFTLELLKVRQQDILEISSLNINNLIINLINLII